MQGQPPNNDAPGGAEESQESIYARNRAIYEASLQQQQQPQSQQARQPNMTQGNLPGFNFDPAAMQAAKQGRPRDDSPERPQSATQANGSTSPQQPQRKKLVRAGDVAARNGSQEPVNYDNNGGLMSASAGTSMREQIARARIPGGPAAIAAGSPTGMPFQQNGAGSPFQTQPSYSPPPNTALSASSGQSAGDADRAIEMGAQSFVAKNPTVPIEIVKGALKHSRGVFDSNFHQALGLLMQQMLQKSNTPGGGAASGGAMSPAGQNPPAPRYPGQQANPTPTQGNYPGFNPYPGNQQQQVRVMPGQQQQVIHPHQMQPSAAQSINGQSAASLTAQGFYPSQVGQGQSPGAGQQPLPQPQQKALPPPPPILVGTHLGVGFSALQVLPKEQHNQFLQLAPSQQTDYSLQVFNSLPPHQQQEFSEKYKAAEGLRRAYYAQQNAAAGAPGQMTMMQAGGGAGRGTTQSPYIGYASQAPTAQQQMQQTRFPGQNPVFRVGAPSNGAATAGGAQSQSQGQHHPQQQQQSQQQYISQPDYMSNQQRMLLEQMNPSQREQFYQLAPQQQAQWVYSQIQMRQEVQKRQAAQHQRAKQQAMMAKTHQAAKEVKTVGGSLPGTKKRRRKAGSDSDNSNDLNLHDDDTDEDRDDEDMEEADGSEAEAAREANAIKWFNEANAEQLMEMTACSQIVADAVLDMRPYASPSDIRVKFRKRKGVSGNLFDNYVDLMHSYTQTDECLASCTDIGKELLEIMKIWTGGKKVDPTPSMRPSAEPEDVKDVKDVKKDSESSEAVMHKDGGDIKVELKSESQGDSKEDVKVVKVDEVDVKPAGTTSGDLLTVPSNGATPAKLLTAESSLNLGTDLATMSEEVLNQSTKEDASEEVKKAFEGYLYTQPKLLKEGIKLKNYQMLGVNWLNLLYKKEISCILADEMGLGKTAQVIALIAHLKEKEQPGPHLVIVPSSTLDNWMREFDNFAPSLKVFAYYGSQAERADARYFFKQEEELDVIVTTYNMATGAPDDRKFLKKMEFKACVFDEGHQLKNAESKKYKDLMEIKVQWRLLLTGTPLQNNLQELVSLLSFILPSIFLEAQESLRAIFKVPPEAQKNLLTRQRVRAAKQVMTPFVLRRKKAQVLQDLPPKTEIVEYCDMTALQRDIYRETLAKHKKAVIEYVPSGTNTPAEKPPPKKRGRAAAKTGKPAQENTTSNVLMSLRKAANHPMLFRRLYDDKKLKQMAKECLKEEEFQDRNIDYIYEDMDLMTDFELHRFVLPYKILGKYALKNDEWMNAGKVQKLMQMLPEMKARGDRVLIFSQFVQVLDILAYVLKTMEMKFLTLTGQTNVNDRQGLVDEYTNDDSITCFLLSTRAGGLGLNLMAANVVIIMDMDFNPHNDKQAQDRAYRLGQKRPVTIYKFVTKGTIEEDMLALADTKLALDQQVSAESAVSGDMAASLELDEQEGGVEKKVKASLMTTLQTRFEADVGEQEYQATQAAEVEPENDEAAETGTPAESQSAAEPPKAIPARSRAAAAGRARRVPPPKRKAPTPPPEGEEGEGGEAEGGEEGGEEEEEEEEEVPSSPASSGGSVFADDGE